MAVNPIDKTQRERIAGAERRLRDAVELIQRCKACGVDVEDREHLAFVISEKLDALKREFMGIQPQGEIGARRS